MDHREMICQTVYELLYATGAVMAHLSDEDIEQHASELERRFGLLAAIYIGVLAERLVDYRDALQSGDNERIHRAWRELLHVSAAANDVLPWPRDIAEISARLSELARAAQQAEDDGGDDAAA